MPRLTKVLARILAVLALAAVAVALFLVVSSFLESSSDDESTGKKTQVDRTNPEPKGDRNKPKEPKRFYEVEPGDTLLLIEQETGVTVARIQELNPDIDTQILQVGQRLRLR